LVLNYEEFKKFSDIVKGCIGKIYDKQTKNCLERPDFAVLKCPHANVHLFNGH